MSDAISQLEALKREVEASEMSEAGRLEAFEKSAGELLSRHADVVDPSESRCIMALTEKYNDIIHLQPLPENCTIQEVYDFAVDSSVSMMQRFHKFMKLTKGTIVIPQVGEIAADAPIISDVNRSSLKSIARVREKTEARYDGDGRRVLDIVRALGLYNTLEDLEGASNEEKLAECGLEIKRARLSWVNSMSLLINLSDSSGHVGELQLRVKSTNEAYRHLAKLSKELRRLADSKERKLQSQMVKNKLDNPEARGRIVDLEQQLSACTFSWLLKKGGDIEAREEQVNQIVGEIKDICEKEEKRIGALTEERKNFYKAAAQRFESLKHIKWKVTGSDEVPVQPLGWGGRAGETLMFKVSDCFSYFPFMISSHSILASESAGTKRFTSYAPRTRPCPRDVAVL